MKITPAGDRALLADLGVISAERLHAAAGAVRALPGVLACIPGQQSLYVIFQGEPQRELVRSAIVNSGAGRIQPRRHEIEVSFAAEDAPDLADLLRHASMTREAFLDRVRGLTLTARYLGFRAGFAYFDGWPGEWRMPRRPTSRLRVPRGSFAIVGPNAGFYTIDSPGGWNLLGRTAAPLWDARRDPPNLIAAGDEVVIVPVGNLGRMPDIAEAPEAARIGGIEIVRNSQFATTVAAQDWRRLDHGLPPGGAFDERAAALTNLAVGNDADAPVLECAMLVPQIRFQRSAVVAWCGARSEMPSGVPIEVVAGDEIGGGMIKDGLRGWLAISQRAAGSGSRPVPAPITTGEERLVIHCVAGPHETPLREITCEVTPQLNRVGIRMRPLERVPFEVPADLPSCGMQFGTIQLHPDGTFVAMGPDHPVTGGYLQPFTVKWDERSKLGQLTPGQWVKFVT